MIKSMIRSQTQLANFYEVARTRPRPYWSLIKSLQTVLLLITGTAGYMSTRCPISNANTILAVSGTLFLAIGGSTVLNMWFDRDIDAKMERTCWRPLPSGQIPPREALALGLILSGLGVGWAMSIDMLYGLVVFAGLFFDVVVYTIWLKRRTAWSITWGGVAGGMPILAGRVLGEGRLEWIGLLLMMAVLCWIPTHILTYSIRYKKDYQRAGVPTFPSRYGVRTTRRAIAFSSIVASLCMVAAATGIGVTSPCLYMIAFLAGGLLLLAAGAVVTSSEKANYLLFKYASLYMLCSMLLVAFDIA